MSKKLLLYCTKAKPYIMKYKDGKYKEIASFYNKQDLATYDLLNGKIVAECDFEVEEIFRDFIDGKDYTINPNGVWVKSYYFKTKTLYANELYSRCCLTFEQIYNYFDNEDDKLVGYAIHIKNLHIFDKPRELSDYLTWNWVEYSSGPVYAIPQKPITRLTKMISVTSLIYDSGDFAIPVSPQEMCRIANGEQTALVRKKVLKEMLV